MSQFIRKNRPLIFFLLERQPTDPRGFFLNVFY